MQKTVALCLFLVVYVFAHSLDNAPFTCANEEMDKDEQKRLDQLAVCAAPSVNSCYHKDKIAQYPSKPNVLVPIVFYGVDCHAEDVASFPENVAITTSTLNKLFRPMGIFFESSIINLPCKGTSGKYNMASPTNTELRAFLSAEVKYKNPRKFVILISRASGVSYAGFHGLGAKYGFFVYKYMTNKIVAAHELGHGFGLQHTFYRTTAPTACACAENDNTPDHYRGDYCADTPGCPKVQSRSANISTSSLSNGCPKNETFWNNPVNNIMSYNFGPVPEFSECQIKRARCFWETRFKKNTDFKNTTDLTCFGESFDDACGKRGICVNKDKCICDTGYYGDKCELYNCNGVSSNSPTVCNGFGNCTALDTCSCNTGHSNKYCDGYYCFGVDKRSSSVCSTHGNCVAHDTCKCDATYGGSKCHLTNKNVCYGLNALDSKACSGIDKGECRANDKCTCFTGYSGKDCSYWECFGKNNTDTTGCSGKGICTGADKCTCQSGFTGAKCDQMGNVNNFATSMKYNLISIIFGMLISLLLI
eukprot:gene8808-758_t